MTKESVLQIRCSPEDRTLWNAAALAAGLKTAEWIRRSLLAIIQAEPASVPEATRFANPFPHLPKSKYQPSKACDAPGDRCKRFGAPTCEPCRKAFEAKEVRS